MLLIGLGVQVERCTTTRRSTLTPTQINSIQRQQCQQCCKAKLRAPKCATNHNPTQLAAVATILTDPPPHVPTAHNPNTCV